MQYAKLCQVQTYAKYIEVQKVIDAKCWIGNNAVAESKIRFPLWRRMLYFAVCTLPKLDKTHIYQSKSEGFPRYSRRKSHLDIRLTKVSPLSMNELAINSSMSNLLTFKIWNLLRNEEGIFSWTDPCLKCQQYFLKD